MFHLDETVFRETPHDCSILALVLLLLSSLNVRGIVDHETPHDCSMLALALSWLSSVTPRWIVHVCPFSYHCFPLQTCNKRWSLRRFMIAYVCFYACPCLTEKLFAYLSQHVTNGGPWNIDCSCLFLCLPFSHLCLPLPTCSEWWSMRHLVWCPYRPNGFGQTGR